MEGLIFGGAYLRREICVSKSIGLALQLEGNLPFLLSFTLNLRAIFQVQAPRRAYIWWDDLTEGFLRYRIGGLIHGGAFFFRNFTVSFDALWKFLWSGKSSLGFWGVKFWSRDCLGFCLKP